MRKSEVKERSVLNNILQYCILILIGLLISFILILIFSALITYTNIPESFTLPASIIATAIGVFTSSALLCIKSNMKGIYSALVVGIIFLLIKMLGYRIAFGAFSFQASSWINIVCILVFAIAGDLFGANFKK